MYNKSFAKIYNKLWCGFSEKVADNILKLEINKNAVLDLGCGTGNFLKKMEKLLCKDCCNLQMHFHQ